MRIRFPFLIAFIAILLLSSSAGLLPHSALPSAPENVRNKIPRNTDKVAHFLCFFSLTGTFYFIFDTARRRVLHITLIACTFVLALGSEVAQGLLPNDREFDLWDVLANVLGSLAALGIANAYHKRAAERRRRAKFAALLGEGAGDDVELGEGPGVGGELGGPSAQETGVVSVQRSVEEELADWDENVPDDDWDGDDGAKAKMTPATSSTASEDAGGMVKKVAVD